MFFEVDSDGGYNVEGRFCDLYGDGRMTLCELRMQLHCHDEDDAA